MRKFFILILFILNSAYLYSQVGLRPFGRKENNIEINYSNPKTYTIAEIQVIGTKYLDHNALISLSGLKQGDEIKIPGEAITGAIKKLWHHGILADVSISISKVNGDKVYLVIELTERPRLTRYIIEGLSKTQESELKDKIGLIRGKVVTDAMIKNTTLNIQKYLEEKGFLNAQISVTEEEDTVLGNNINLIIKVDKEDKVKIKEVTFSGNNSFEKEKLKKQLKSTKEHKRLTIFKDIANKIYHFRPKHIVDIYDTTITKKAFKSYINENVKINIFNSSKFVREEFEDDKKKLITFYNSKGFRDATVTNDSIYLSEDGKLNVHLTIDEGTPYYFRNITWTGNYIHEAPTLDKILNVKKGDIYDIELINQKLNFNPNGQDISALYMDDGYLGFRVDPVEIKVEGDSIDIEMRVNEGVQYTINKIIISGNDRTKDHVILREIRTLPGEKFSRAKLIRTQRELAQLGYFDPEKMGITPYPNPNDGTVDIEYSLEEKPSDQVELSGGWGGAFGFVGTLGLVFNNFSMKDVAKPKAWRPLPVGDGQQLALRFQATGRRFQSYSATFSEPWLGGKKPNSLSVSLRKSIQRNINREANVIGFLKLSSVSVGLGRRVKWPDDFFIVRNSFNYTFYELDSIGQSLGFTRGTANNFNINTTLSRNSVDNPMYPRIGSQVSLSITLTPPYSQFNNLDYNTATNQERYKWVEYHKWMFDASYFLKLAGNLVLNTRAHFGFIGSYDKEAGVGPFERFNVGGDGMSLQGSFLLGTDVIGLRGYENNSIFPLQEGETSEDDIRGGTVFNKFVFELRYPLSLNPAATIYVSSFAEAGNNWITFNEFNPNNLFRSAGMGVNIFMPAFGLIGINWGYGFDTLPGFTEKSGGQLHFTIGQQIR